MKQARVLVHLASIAALTACAAPAEDYPSLAIRDAERFVGSMAPAEARTYTPAPLPADTLAQIAELERRALAAHNGFLADEPLARRRSNAARGSSPGSESWAQAQVAIAVLEGHRGDLMIALADLDRIYVDTSSAGAAIAGVEDARDTIAGLLRQENAVISELLATVQP